MPFGNLSKQNHKLKSSIMLYFIILALILVMVSLISSKSGLLRNELFSQENLCKIAKAEGIKDPPPAYSLGRTQLAFWMMIIVSSSIYAILEKSSRGIFVSWRSKGLTTLCWGLRSVRRR
jgi:hypothetical protein